ncbi:MAG TPA: aminodeoxychorismate/anthranilate synthase component II [Sediminibacterium sp.]|uniref:anthranilate synthase component II n=1 Tax=Sediminibacterium sp. TaxID=1917865 RepID=UPI0008B9BD16|nr:aminodeoxychorismate/anthranilate synthase component II [Sediminibacterium sp.]OHC85352.1 MAG: aminodeoxychorismate/anthranilate synthase component II [Sphingobacteriia bacterium RIFOXYC2_FULL_35_18]OHC89410.1 MAG: aminodeoxychorismate/anthranilate synthase component II [Sphingobacteriia bacterium RIFOXYD2_FULL_35_12]HLD53648.1 aminodeoxychorismate/anthranilate synthase component II [Sediminibacterium sp.]
MKILVFDNYDSFTYNLVHLIAQLTGNHPVVCRNDEIELSQIKQYDKILLSPGPGIPSEAGLLQPLVKEYAASKSILGVCLGHQAIGEVFGAKLINLSTVFHGVATPIQIENSINDKASSLYDGLPNQIEVGRYHSWVVSDSQFPTCLKITAKDDNGFIMGLAHTEFDVEGVQFHPESILTPDGATIIKNWLKR